MKLLFLDIDGVLNSTGSVLARTSTRWNSLSDDVRSAAYLGITCVVGDFGYGPQQSMMTVDPTAVELVNRLLDRAKADVVLSSSHRTFFTGSNYEKPVQYNSPEHLRLLQWYLELLGLRVNLVGITPKLHTRRGLEVKAYLEQYDEEIVHVTLDDGTDFQMSDCVHYKVDPVLGFNSNDYFVCAKLLGVDESPIIF